MPSSQNPPEKMMFQLSLRRRGISDQTVLRAMEEIPREAFVEAADRANLAREEQTHLKPSASRRATRYTVSNH